MSKIKLGSTVMVSDPCYTTETWCQAKIENVLQGEYNIHCEKYDTGDWGERCSLLIAFHKDYNINNLDWEIHPAEIGVDSGQAGIFDIASYRKDGMDIETPKVGYDGLPFDKLEEILKPQNDGDDWYLKMCKLTLSSSQWGWYESGVVSRSGYGDGGYTLHLAKDGDKVVGFCIDFLVEEEELSEKFPFIINYNL